jgi:tripartite-type tricarboxylate transporter receptor subunit TctC
MKRFLALLVLLACALAAAPAVQAQGAYPARPVKIVCGFPAGSSLDIITRIYAQKLEESLGQPFIVENRVGAAGNVAAEATARAPADGYTLLSDGIAQAISMSLFKNVTFDIVADFEPIGFIGSTPAILVVNAEVGVKSVAELIALAKSRPGQLTHGTSGVGTAPHMAAELFNLMAGVKLLHVPYRGTNQAIVDLLGGRLSLMFSPAPTIAPHAGDAKLKLLATTSARRSSLFPDLPALGEQGGLEGFDTSLWFGLWAPKGTPKEIVKTINEVLVKATATPAVKSQLAANGADPVTGTPEEFGVFVREEVKKWAKVVAVSGAKVD